MLFAQKYVAFPSYLADYSRHVTDLDGEQLGSAIESFGFKCPDGASPVGARVGGGCNAMLHLPPLGDKRLRTQQLSDRPDLQVASVVTTFQEFEGVDP